MYFEAVRIVDLRIVREAVLRLEPGVNLLLGSNAAGKTTILEALSLLAQGRTFRRGGAGSLVRVGAEAAALEGRVVLAGGRRLGERIDLGRGRIRARWDGTSVRSRSELARRLPVVVLGADAVSLVEGGPAARRRLIDWTGFLSDADYLPRIRDYRRALQQRNAALRRGDRTAAAWDAALVRTGEVLTRLRAGCVEALNAALERAGGWPWRGRLTMAYRPGWPGDRTLAEALAERREVDRRAGVTGVGPHRADVRFEVTEGGVTVPLSRGQMKLAVLRAAVAQAMVVGEGTGEWPVVLVDDLAAELDERSRDAALALLAGYPGQVVAAGLGREQAPRRHAKVFHVEHGRVTEMVQ